MGEGDGVENSIGVTARLIKVGRTTQMRSSGGSPVVVPFIRLSGKWLERAGFLEGDVIEVTAAKGEIRLVRQGQRGGQISEQAELF